MKFDSQVQTLGDLMRLDSGFAFKSSEWVESGTPVIKIRNVQDSFVDLSGCSFVNEKTAKKAAGWYGQVGNTLIALTGAGVGEIGRIHENQTGLINQRVGWVRPKDNEEEDYIYYLLRFFKNEIIELASGSAQPNVSPRDILKIPCQVPKKQERRTIGNLLTALDSKIATNNALSKTLEDIAQTIFKSWFIDFDPVKARMAGEKPAGMDAATAALFPDSMEESELGLIPKGWEVRKIESLCETLLGGTPSRTRNEFWGGEIPWINSGKVNDFRITAASEYITELGLEKSATKLLPKGTTVLAITGATLGQFSRLEIVSCANQSVVGILGSTEASNEFIYLNIKNGIQRLISAQTGGAQQHINKEDVNAFLIVYPGKKLMNAFTDVVGGMFAEIGALSIQSIFLAEIRDSLLPRLISGELQIPEEMLAS
jgi:type I restriction enzyme S subunit